MSNELLGWQCMFCGKRHVAPPEMTCDCPPPVPGSLVGIDSIVSTTSPPSTHTSDGSPTNVEGGEQPMITPRQAVAEALRNYDGDFIERYPDEVATAVIKALRETKPAQPLDPDHSPPASTVDEWEAYANGYNRAIEDILGSPESTESGAGEMRGARIVLNGVVFEEIGRVTPNLCPSCWHPLEPNEESPGHFRPEGSPDHGTCLHIAGPSVCPCPGKDR